MLRLIHSQGYMGGVPVEGFLVDDLDDGLPNKQTHRLGSTADPKAYSRDGYAASRKQPCYVPRTNPANPSQPGYIDLVETDRVIRSASNGKISGFQSAGMMSTVSFQASELDSPVITSAALNTPEIGDLTIDGTTFLSVLPDVTSVTLSGPGVGSVTLTKTQIEEVSPGVVGSTQIIIDSTLIPGMLDGDSVTVTSNHQDATGTTEAVLLITSPAPGATFIAVIPSAVSLAGADGLYEISFDSNFAGIRGNVTISGGTGTGSVTADASDNAKSVMYVRKVGGTVAEATLICTVIGYVASFTSPAPGTVFYEGAATSVSISATIDDNYELSFDSDFSNIRGNITVVGGVGTGNVTAVAADSGKTTLYVRQVGGTIALDTLSCSVVIYVVNFTSPAPGTVFVVGVATSASITSTIDGNYELSFDSDFSNIRGNITVTGGTGSGNVTADAADVGKLVLCVRPVGGSVALATLACTVISSDAALLALLGAKDDAFWHRADYGVTEVGGKITAWLDKLGHHDLNDLGAPYRFDYVTLSGGTKAAGIGATAGMALTFSEFGTETSHTFCFAYEGQAISSGTPACIFDARAFVAGNAHGMLRCNNVHDLITYRTGALASPSNDETGTATGTVSRALAFVFDADRAVCDVYVNASHVAELSYATAFSMVGGSGLILGSAWYNQNHGARINLVDEVYCNEADYDVVVLHALRAAEVLP